ncbi:MAG: ABC transporter transmembrane domain-containing protein, partial [Solirubrobacteraceae bacterium]
MTSKVSNSPNKKSKVSINQVFKTIIWPRRKIVSIGIILIIISRLASLVLPGASKYLIDEVIVNKDLVMLKTLLLVVAVSIAVNAITSFMLTKILSVEAQHLISKLRVQVQKKILSLPISFYDNSKSGALVSRIMTDVEGVRNLIGTGLVQLIGGTITAVIALVLLIKISLLMTLYTLVPII